jgi:hypothetical protein
MAPARGVVELTDPNAVDGGRHIRTCVSVQQRTKFVRRHFMILQHEIYNKFGRSDIHVLLDGSRADWRLPV